MRLTFPGSTTFRQRVLLERSSSEPPLIITPAIWARLERGDRRPIRTLWLPPSPTLFLLTILPSRNSDSPLYLYMTAPCLCQTAQ